MQENVIVGSAAHADMKLEGPNVGAEHARIAQKRGGVFCTALQGDEDDLSSNTHTWIDGCEIRKGETPFTVDSAGFRRGTLSHAHPYLVFI